MKQWYLNLFFEEAKIMVSQSYYMIGLVNKSHCLKTIYYLNLDTVSLFIFMLVCICSTEGRFVQWFSSQILMMFGEHPGLREEILDGSLSTFILNSHIHIRSTQTMKKQSHASKSLVENSSHIFSLISKIH